jgi:hypothetical protein
MILHDVGAERIRRIFSYLEPYSVVLANVCRAWRNNNTGSWDFVCENPDLLVWGIERGIKLTVFLSRAVAKKGSLPTSQRARTDGCPWDKWTCAYAAQNGHLEVLQWVRANGCPWDEQTRQNAAENGHIEVLRWARASGCP